MAEKNISADSQASSEGASGDNSATNGNGKIVALLSGQGAQYSGMMKELYDSFDIIRSILDSGERIFKESRGYSLLEIMFGDNDSLNSTENTQPAVFISSASIFQYLKEKGFIPDYFIGHSLGEYSALYCSEILDFEDAMNLVLKRSDLMKRASEKFPGKIMVALMGGEEIDALIKKSSITNIYIANKNSDRQTAVAGGAPEIDNFCSFLDDEEVTFKKLDLSGAFHTPLFSEASEELGEYLGKLQLNDTDYTSIISNVTGEFYPQDAGMIKELLTKQVISPVEFVKSIELAYKSGGKHFIEIGPNRILASLLKRIEIGSHNSISAANPRKGQCESFELLLEFLKENKII